LIPPLHLSFINMDKQISYIHSCVYFLILIFVSLFFNIPLFSQSSLHTLLSFASTLQANLYKNVQLYKL
jgi:hypothetical protein